MVVHWRIISVGATSVALILFSIAKESSAVSVEKDLTLTWAQKEKLDEFKELMLSFLPHEYMKEDIYLIRWLRARNFNLNAAETMLLQNLEWREQNKMDTIIDEDWTEFREKYKYWDHGRDKQGNPMAYLSLGEWDLRRVVISGEREKMHRYLIRVMEIMALKVRKLQAAKENVTQYDLFADIQGFSLTQQGCLQCIPIYIYFVSMYEQHYPGFADKVILVNSPAAFELILSAIRPFLSQMTRDSMEIYGTNKNFWEPIVYSYADRDQLPPAIGGTDYKKYEDF